MLDLQKPKYIQIKQDQNKIPPIGKFNQTPLRFRGWGFRYISKGRYRIYRSDFGFQFQGLGSNSSTHTQEIH